MGKRQKRFEVLAERAVNQDGFIKEWIDVGLVAMESPNDPTPDIMIENGTVLEMDGKRREEFDMIDIWIADHCIDTTVAEEAMAIDSLEIARMLVDISVPRTEIVRLSVFYDFPSFCSNTDQEGFEDLFWKIVFHHFGAFHRNL